MHGDVYKKELRTIAELCKEERKRYQMLCCSRVVSTALFSLASLSWVYAQQSAVPGVPNVIRYSGSLKDVRNAILSSAAPVGVTFAIYKQEDGGAPIWQETQNVTPDSNGQYSVVLGSSSATGLPDDLFSQQEQRWLGVQVQGQEEQARVLLVSVPYAIKAHEAETLGGLPPSAFVKVAPTDVAGSAGTDTGTTVNALSVASRVGTFSRKPLPPAIVMNSPCPPGTPSANFVPLWFFPAASSNVICNSVIFQMPVGAAGKVGVGTTSPQARLDVNGNINSSAGYYISGNGVLLINRSLNNLIVGGNSVDINGGEFNTFSGIDAGFTNGTGHANTFSGAEAGYANTSGQANAFTGTQTGARNTTGSFGSFYGTSAGLNSNADWNTFMGVESGFLTTTGSDNTFLGAEAGNSNLIGSFNTFSGRQAGFNSTASHGSFYGYKAGYSNTADGNSFFGDQAGLSNTSGGENTFVGDGAGSHNVMGSGNTYIGSGAGQGVKGDNNVFIGQNAGLAGSNIVCLACGFPFLIAGADNGIFIGNLEVHTSAWIQGVYGASTSSGGLPVFVDVNGKLGTIVSSQRFKEQIHDMDDSSSKLFQLRPVTFLYRPQYDDGSRTLQYGLIAEEVAKIYPDMVAYDKDGQPYTVKYQYLAPMLLNELQKQHTVVTAQQDVIKAQQEEINEMQQRLSRLEALLDQPARTQAQN